jgi:hypothetical protein
MRCRRRCRAACRRTADARGFQLQTAVLNKAVRIAQDQFAAINECHCTRQRGGHDAYSLRAHAIRIFTPHIITYHIACIIGLIVSHHSSYGTRYIARRHACSAVRRTRGAKRGEQEVVVAHGHGHAGGERDYQDEDEEAYGGYLEEDVPHGAHQAAHRLADSHEVYDLRGA